MSSYIERQQQTDRVNPFQSDYQGILSGLQARTEYWKIGTQQVRSAYEQAAGLSLTGNSNKDRLKQFMSDADGQLKKALASDLSMYDNAANAVQIYKPLYKDREIMADYRTTEGHQKAISDANSWRTKDNGKYYSDTNYRDVINSYQDFKEGVNRGESAENYVDKVRQYTPYYDVTKESFDLMSKCKGDQVSQMGAYASDSLLFETKTDNSLTASKLTGCLGSMSEKARTQLTIEQRTRYHNNPQGLAEAWRSLGEKNIDSVAKQLQNARLKANQFKADPEQYQYFTQLGDSLNEQLKGLQSNIDDINKGDYSDVANNFDNYAQQLGLYSHARQFGNAFSYQDRATELSGNPANLQRNRQNFEVQQGNTDFRRDIYMENLRSTNDFTRDVQLKQLTNQHDFEVEFFKKFGRKPTQEELLSINSGAPLKDPNDIVYTPTQDATVDQNGIKAAQDLHTQVQASSDIITQAGNDLSSKLQSIGDGEVYKVLGINPARGFNPNGAKDIDGQMRMLQTIVESNDKVRQENLKRKSQGLAEVELPYSNSSVAAMRDYISTVNEQKRTIATKNKIIELNESQIDKQVQGDRIQAIKDISGKKMSIQLPGFSKGKLQVSGSDIYNLLTTNKAGLLTRKPNTSGLTGKALADRSGSAFTYYYNGKEIPQQVVENSGIIEAQNDIFSIKDRVITKESELRNQIYGTSRFVSNDIHTAAFTSDPKLAEQVKKEAIKVLNITGENPDKAFDEGGFNVVGYTNKNELVVSTGDSEIDPQTIFSNKGRVIPDAKKKLIAFPSGAVLSNVKMMQGLTDNEDLQTLHTAFKNSPQTVGKSEVLRNDNVRRVKTESDKPIRLVGFKNRMGQMSYSIETKTPTGKWDTDAQGTHNNIRDWESALYMYETLMNTIKAN